MHSIEFNYISARQVELKIFDIPSIVKLNCIMNMIFLKFCNVLQETFTKNCDFRSHLGGTRRVDSQRGLLLGSRLDILSSLYNIYTNIRLVSLTLAPKHSRPSYTCEPRYSTM